MRLNSPKSTFNNEGLQLYTSEIKIIQHGVFMNIKLKQMGGIDIYRVHGELILIHQNQDVYLCGQLILIILIIKKYIYV